MAEKPIEKRKTKIENSKRDASATITSQAEAARYCGVTIRTIRNKEKDYPLKDGRGNYIPEMLDRYVKASSQEPSSLKEKTLFADLELKGKKAELAQWELDLRAGKYVLADDVEQQTIARIVECRRALLALPRKLSAKLEQRGRADIQQILQQEMAYCLDVFAGQKVTPPADPVVEVMEYYELLDRKDRARFKEMLGKRGKKKIATEITEATEEKNIHHEETSLAQGRGDAGEKIHGL